MSVRFSVEKICQEHGITRQGYHQARAREQATKKREAAALAVVREERKHQPRLGTRKLYELFWRFFRRLKLGRDKLFELLRRAELLAEPRRRRLNTTDSQHDLRRFENLVRDFLASRPDELWVADMTYVPVGDGFAYASIVMDAFSRRIVGYHLAGDLRTAGPLRALEMALAQARCCEGLIHHSDQGSQYCSHEYVRTLDQHGCRISMSRKGNPYDNAMAERVIGTLKNEYGLAYGFRSLTEARKALAEAVELYNTRRPHLELAYQTPDEAYAKAA